LVILFYFLVLLGFELRFARQVLSPLEPLHQPPPPATIFCDGFFEIESWELFALCWFWAMILLISVSWVARNTGVSHWHLAALVIFEIGSHFMLGPAWTMTLLFMLPA
jgi:hypothetical protein